ncbi:MAG: protein-disulfide reductase DsbD domain-containing protein [Hyphomicrobiales bacterium]
MVYAVLALAPAPAVASPQATEWVRYTHSEVRMVRGIVRADGAVEMGVQVKLSPGWKTYWRVPGDSGVPPDFNWSRSANVRDIDVLWPTPSRFRDQFGDNIGYKDEVLFPLVVMPGDGTKPLTVKMNLNYAVCADVCVPVQADLSLDIPMQSVWPRHAAEIARYMRLVPKPPEEVSGLKVAAVTVDRTGKRPELIVDVTCEDPARPMDLFVEGDQSLFFGVPAETASDVGGRKRFRIPVDSSAGDAALKSGELRFVVVDGDKRLAQTWLLQ